MDPASAARRSRPRPCGWLTSGPGRLRDRRFRMPAMRRRGRLWFTVTTTSTVLALIATSGPACGSASSGGFSLLPTYRANDYAGGQAMDILPAGENGLVNQQQFLKFIK